MRRALGFAAAAWIAGCYSDPGLSASPGVDEHPDPAPRGGVGMPTGPLVPRVAPPYDVGSTATTIANWPRLVPGVETRAFSSFDRTGGNDDGFSSGQWSRLYTNAANEAVIFDAAGPGVLRTMWFTSGTGPFENLGFGALKFFFDGEDKPRITVDADALFRGEVAPFSKPLVEDGHTSTGGRVSWVPLPFRGRLIVTAERTPAFYAMHYETFPSDWDVASWHAGNTDGALQVRFTETTPVADMLEAAPLDVTKTGAGIVDVLRFEPDAAPTDAQARAARIRAWFDDGEPRGTPQIDVPLTAFFGSGLGPTTLTSIPWSMSAKVWESRLPMPYWQNARISIEGLSGKLSLRVAPQTMQRSDAGYLFVRSKRQSPVTPGADFVYADEADASGKLVATVLTVFPGSPSSKRWWEGDLRTRIDGARAPSIHGTGHEDDHLGGWSNEFLSMPFSLAMQGCPRSDVIDAPAGGQVNANATMYRVWPGIPFLSRLRHSTEHGYTDDVTYEGATFVYRRAGGSRLVRTDAVDLGDAASAAAHHLDGEGPSASLTSTFEGDATRDPGVETGSLTAVVRSFERPFAVTLAIDADNAGVMLRRLYDAATRQTARIAVDGAEVGAFVQADTNPSARWGERDFFLPPSVTRGRASIVVRIAPVDGPVTAARLEAHAVKP